MASQVEICNLALDMLGESNITSIAGTEKAAGLLSRRWDYAVDELLRDFPWSFARKSAELEYTDGYSIYQSSDEKDITAISSDNPALVTISLHGCQTGYHIKIDDVEGMTELNERVYTITRITENTFSLDNIDSSVYTAYTSGGKAVRYEVDPDYQSGYTYDLPDDFLCDPEIDGKKEFEIVGWNDGTNQTRRLLTTVEDAILHYTRSMSTSDIAKFPPHFISALAATLARMVYKPLFKKGSKNLQEMWTEFAAVVAQAKMSDAGYVKLKEGNYNDPILNAGGYE